MIFGLDSEQWLSNSSVHQSPGTACWAAPSESPSQQVLGGAPESAFLTSSQVMLMLLVWGPRIENHWSRAVSHPWVHPGISKSFQRCSWPSLRSGLIGLRWGPDTGGFTQCPGDSNVQPQCRGALLLSSAALRLEPGLFTLQCQVRLLYKKNYSQPLNTLGVRGTGMPSWTLPCG